MRGSTGKAKIAKGLEFSQTMLNVIGVDAVGVWSFDEGNGPTAFDKSGYGNHGTITGATHATGEENTPHWFVNEGQGRSSLKFNGGDTVNCGHGSSLKITTEATIEMWINPSAWATGEHPIYNGLYRIYHRGAWAGDGIYFLYRITSGEWPGDSAWSGWAGVKTSTQLATGKWYHIVGTMFGDNMKIYVNGKMERELDCLSGQTIRTSGFGDLLIGRNNFNGEIDEVRIYASALSSAEIQQHYAESAPRHQLAINDN